MKDIRKCVEDWSRIHKEEEYYDIYPLHFERFRNKPVTVVEAGVYVGGSLKLWREYFGEKAVIHGIDVNPSCADCAGERINIHIGNVSDLGFWEEFRKIVPQPDIVIDDCGHTMEEQNTLFREIYPHIAPGGVYLCEDVCTSYWHSYGGGLKKGDTFIENMKNHIDLLNAEDDAGDDPNKFSLKPDDFTRTTHSMHFYPKVVVIEKNRMR